MPRRPGKPTTIPKRLRELVATAPFWSDYLGWSDNLGDDEFGERVTGLPADPYVELPLSPLYSLRIGYFWRASRSAKHILATDLRLRHKDSGEDTLLGWINDSHFHPHVLRWEEADLIGRLQALRDPELPHPGVPFLLLLPYIAPVEGTDHLLGLQLLNSALQSLRVFDKRQIQYRLSAFKPTPAVSEWRQIDRFGWVCHYSPSEDWMERGHRMIYSLRQVPAKKQRRDWPRFPFDAWNDCMRHAEQVVAESPQPRVRKTRTKPLPALSERVELRYQVTRCEEAIGTIPVLRRTLQKEGLGVCEILGSWCAFENQVNPWADIVHPNAGDEFIVVSYGELAKIVAVFRRVVEEAGRPDVRLYQRMYLANSPPYRRIAL
jgi:hypothetical protein